MDSNYFSRDAVEFIGLLHKYKVKYVIVGGEAVIYHGYPRLTGDIDIFYSSAPENCSNLYNALLEFWNGDIPGIKNGRELQSTGYIVQFGVPPNRLDIMNSVDGITFIEAWENKITEHVMLNKQKVPVFFIGLEQLIKNKKASGRDKDMDDLEYLNRV